MVDFPTSVSPPGGASYSAPLLNFSNFSNWAADDPFQKVFNEQQQQLNQQRIQKAQQEQEIARTFQGGLPRDPKTGQIDYAKAVAMLAQKGDINALWNGADAMAIQGAGNLSPLFTGGGQPQGQPQSVAAKPLPPVAANSPQGDPGSGTVAALVTDRLPNQDTTTGQTIAKIAQTMGVDPNATLTPGQLRRAQGLLAKYVPSENGGPTTFASRFAAADGQGGSLPPSANAVSAAPRVTQRPAIQPGPPAGGQPAPQPAAPQPQQAAPIGAPAQPQGGPITPQVPLPKGFTDPQAAILALRTEAARLSANPRAAGQVNELNNWAKRIEDSIAPVDVGPSTTRIDPRTGQILYQGPAAAMMTGAAGRSETLESDAAVYRQTGKLPTNIGRGVQGNAESHAIRTLAREQEIAEGGDPGEWPTRWQKFGTQAAGRRTLEVRAAGLTLAENEASSLLPRVRQASANVSRTEYPSINSLINAAKKGSGGTDVIKLGVAIESLIPVYARVLKPVGQIGVTDTQNAHQLLDKAWSDGQINAALDQMQVELGSARTALNKTMEEFGMPKEKREKGAAATAPINPAAWKTLPNGARIQEVH